MWVRVQSWIFVRLYEEVREQNGKRREGWVIFIKLDGGREEWASEPVRVLCCVMGKTAICRVNACAVQYRKKGIDVNVLGVRS